MNLLVSCQFVHVCVAIKKLLLQKCLSMKCRYVHVSVCILMYLHVSACICMYLQIINRYESEYDAINTDNCYDSVFGLYS